MASRPRAQDASASEHRKRCGSTCFDGRLPGEVTWSACRSSWTPRRAAPGRPPRAAARCECGGCGGAKRRRLDQIQLNSATARPPPIFPVSDSSPMYQGRPTWHDLTALPACEKFSLGRGSIDVHLWWI
jgi:hypothetical protein